MNQEFRTPAPQMHPDGMVAPHLMPGGFPPQGMPPMMGMPGGIPRPEGMGMFPMPMQFAAPFGGSPFIPAIVKTNEMIISNVHSFVTDQMIYQLLDKYNPKYVTRKTSRAGKTYFRVGFNNKEKMMEARKKFNNKNLYGHYMKVIVDLDPTDEKNITFVEGIEEGITPQMLEDLLTEAGFQVNFIHFPTSPTGTSSPGSQIGSEYKPDGFAAIHFLKYAPSSKTTEDAIKLLDGYSFPSFPDIKLTAKPFFQFINEKQKDSTFLYCSNLPSGIQDLPDKEISEYLFREVIKGNVGSKDQVTITVYRKESVYATMKFENRENAMKVLEENNRESRQKALFFKLVKPKRKFLNDFREKVKSKRIIMLFDIRQDVDSEELEKIFRCFEGFEEIIKPEGVKKYLNSKCLLLSFQSELLAKKACLSLQGEMLVFEIDRTSTGRNQPRARILLEKAGEEPPSENRPE